MEAERALASRSDGRPAFGIPAPVARACFSCNAALRESDVVAVLVG